MRPVEPGFGAYASVVLTVPTDPRDRSILEAVDARTAAIVDKKYGFGFSMSWMATTMTVVFFRFLIMMMAQELSSELKNGTKTTAMGFDFYSLFTVIVSNAVSEKAEKEGNINTFFLIGEDKHGKHGVRTISLITNGPPGPEEDNLEEIPMQKFSDPDPERQKFNIELDRAVRYELSRRNSISIPYTTQEDQERNALCTIAIAYHYMEQLFVELLARLANPNEALGETHEHVIINLLDLLEIHAECKDDGAMIYIRPGIDAKRYAKNDEATENTMGDMSGVY